MIKCRCGKERWDSVFIAMAFHSSAFVNYSGFVDTFRHFNPQPKLVLTQILPDFQQKHLKL